MGDYEEGRRYFLPPSPFADDLRLRGLADDDPYGGGKKKEFVVDYTALSVAIWTLLIVLIVETLRHRLDVKAANRPFFRTVLGGVYQELSTLGIVEAFVFLMQAYIEGFSSDIKKVFAKVHFLLFYAAIFNATMSVVLAVISTRISDRMWIQTEELELNHYIAIREEFDRIDAALRHMEGAGAGGNRRSAGGGGGGAPSPEARRARAEEDRSLYNSGEGGGCLPYDLHMLWVGMKQRIQYPMLKRKHDRLLVQVRFHELRVHFLKANDLPLKFRVSEYLMKSEVHVFKKMVHISTFAWLTVVIAVELVYFFMGITAYVSKSQRVVGTALSSIYFGLCIGFVPISAVIFEKMKHIFSQIMHMKLIDYKGDEAVEEEKQEEDGSSTASDDLGIIDRHQKHAPLSKGLELHQLNLFWGGDPHYIIGAFQFMQLGYALAAAILFIFYPDVIDVKYAKIDGWWFIVALAVCYVAFVLIMAQVIPRYTLCTSLGQLVNRRRLHETMAKYRLEEARKKRRQQMEEKEIRRSMAATVRGRGGGGLSMMKKAVPGPTRNLTKKLLGEGGGGGSGGDTSEGESERSELTGSTHKMAQLAELVQTSTRDLPSLPPPKSATEIRKERRRTMMKSMSDGVAAMASMTNIMGGGVSDAAATELSGMGESPPSNLPPASVASFRTSPAVGGAHPTPTPPPPATRPSRPRRRLQKSRSENVSSMRSPKLSLYAPGAEMSSSEEKEEESADGTAPALLRPFGIPVKRESLTGELPALMEDIPSRSCGGASLDVPLGGGVVFGDGNENGQDGVVRKTDGVTSAQMRDAEPLATLGGEEREGTKIKMDALSEEDDGADSNDDAADDDEDTVGTNESESGHSDFDDVPEASDRLQGDEPKVVPESLGDHLRSFFFSRKFRLINAVAGTMIVFFIVGMRVEIMLLAGPNPIMKNIGNTWHLNPSGAFWWEVMWLGLFISSSLFMFYLFFAKVGCSCATSQAVDDSPELARIAAACDVILSAACLILLLVSEVKRDPCCEGDCYDASDCKNVCYAFGSRVCGGLGQIEPFTSIIVLREFRYRLAAFILRISKKFQGAENGEEDDQHHVVRTESGARQQKRLVTTTYRGHLEKTVRPHEVHDGHEAKSLAHETGTIVELWKIGIGLYPHIVEKYGPFSSELLQAMLGLDIIEDDTGNGEDDSGPSAKSGEDTSDVTTPTSPKGVTGDEMPHEATNPSAMSLSGRYKKLDPKTQGIILAGQIGKPVCTRQASNASNEGGSDGNRSLVLTKDASPSHGDHGDRGVELFHTPSPERPSQLPPSPVEFELDEKQDAKEKAEDSRGEDLTLFVDPNARLIRSLRRCQRRLPPMLDTWAVVDVALTKYELVYFEASDAYDTTDGDFQVDPATSQKRHTVKQALIATKGGKGLRLRDVAIGRKVVGHLELQDIDIIKVEHHTPLPSREVGEVEADDGMDSDVVQEEYWKQGPNLNMMEQRQRRHHRWKYVDEYRLKLHSMQGLLFLRFYSDLEESEMSPPEPCEDESVGHVHRNDAILWCQTIARLCGPDQLHQKLPHFGEEGSAELRDFLELVDRGNTGIDLYEGGTRIHRIRSRVSLTKSSFSMSRRHVRRSSAADLNDPIISPPSSLANFKEEGKVSMSQRQVKFEFEVPFEQKEESNQNEEPVVGLPV